jgi:hypothetical protein
MALKLFLFNGYLKLTPDGWIQSGFQSVTTHIYSSGMVQDLLDQRVHLNMPESFLSQLFLDSVPYPSLRVFATFRDFMMQVSSRALDVSLVKVSRNRYVDQTEKLRLFLIPFIATRVSRHAWGQAVYELVLMKQMESLSLFMKEIPIFQYFELSDLSRIFSMACFKNVDLVLVAFFKDARIMKRLPSTTIQNGLIDVAHHGSTGSLDLFLEYDRLLNRMGHDALRLAMEATRSDAIKTKLSDYLNRHFESTSLWTKLKKLIMQKSSLVMRERLPV